MTHAMIPSGILPSVFCRIVCALKKTPEPMTIGSRYGYFVGWFMTAIYYPSLTSVLCWLSARYTLVFITSCWPNFPLVIPAEQGKDQW